MFDSLLSQLVVLLLLFAVCFRVLNVAKGHCDSFVILVPISLVLTILLFFAWGVTLPTMAVFLVALFVFFININSLGRIFSGLLSNYYSPQLYITSIIGMVLILFVAAGIVIFRPVKNSAQNEGVLTESIMLTGSYAVGFQERDSLFDSYDAKLLCFEPEKTLIQNKANDLPVILMVAEPRQTAERLSPVAYKLASYGFKVIAADFSPWPFDSVFVRVKEMFQKADSKQHLGQMKNISTARYGAIINLLEKNTAQTNPFVFLMADGICCEGAVAASGLYSDKVDGWFLINGAASDGSKNSVPGWKEGFGFIAEAAPWLEWLLSGTKPLECRDVTQFSSVLVSAQANRVFNNIMAQKTVAKGIQE